MTEPRSSRAPRGEEVEVRRDVVEEQPRVDDRVSKAWVLLVIGVFVAIFAYGVLFGRAGMLSPTPTPEPSPELSPTAELTASPLPSPTAQLSPTPLSLIHI